MLIKVLGSGAGGGLPQWNCNGRNSADARSGKPAVRARTQSSLAVSSDGRDWVLLNASPDIRQQISSTPELQPRPQDGPRNSPIKAVLLTNADVDHMAGLLSLRESQAFTVYATERVLDVLVANSIFDVLNPDYVERVPITPSEAFAVSGPSADTGIRAEPFSVPGKIAIYLEDPKADINFGTREGDTIGLRIFEPHTDASFFYIPGCAALDEPLRQWIRGAELICFDGTLFSNNEMIDQGLLAKSGERMGHMNISGADGTLAAFKDLGIARRIFIHINNSNPVLREDSVEQEVVERAGWEIAHDGMEIKL